MPSSAPHCVIRLANAFSKSRSCANPPASRLRSPPRQAWYEGKEAMTNKEYCAEMKAKLKDGPWKSVALTARITQQWHGTGRVIVADSWFGSVPCIMELFERGLFAVMMVKTAHKGYPKKSLLALLGYDEKKKL